MTADPSADLGVDPAAESSAALEAARRRKWFDWRIVPLVALTVVLMVVVVQRLADPEQFFAALASARFDLLLVALGLLALCQLTAALRWLIILRALGRPVPLVRVIGAMLAMWPFALITPARASDLLRALPLADLAPPFEGAGSVVAEKAIDLQSMCILTFVGALAYGVPLLGPIALGVLVVEWLFIAVLVRRRDLIARLPLLRRRPERIAQLLLAFRCLFARPRWLVLVSVTSLVSWLFAMALLQTMLAMTHAEVPIPATIALWPAAVMAGTLPVTLAGMGTRDVAFLYLVSATGAAQVNEGAVLAGTFGYALVGTVLLAIIGIPWAVRFVLRLGRMSPAPP